MAAVRIIEPDPAVRDLIAMLVRGMGHAVYLDEDAPTTRMPTRLDAVVLEPMCAVGRELLRDRQERADRTPLLYVSVYPRELWDAGTPQPSGHLLKPFGADAFRRELQAAIMRSSP